MDSAIKHNRLESSDDTSSIVPCVNCGAIPEPFIKNTLDYEYGIKWSSILVRCPNCKLVTQEPRIRSEDISKLYPVNYFVHSAASTKRGLYSFLKNKLDAKKINRINSYLPENAVALEVGCGNGAFLHSLEKARPDLTLTGVDIVDPGVFENSKVTFLTGQLEDKDIEESSVDLIFFDDLIEHVEDPVKFLNVCHRLLKPNGVIYGITPDHGSVDRLIFNKYWAGYHYPRHTFLFDHNNIRQILMKTGFTDIKLKGSNGLWVKSFKNIAVTLPATKKRGIIHYASMIAFYPVDLLINVFMCHGEMSFVAHRDA